MKHPVAGASPARRRLLAGAVGLVAAPLLPHGAKAGAEPRLAAAPAPPALDARPDAQRHRLALVLSGGCTRAFAHVGVIKVLEAEGIAPDLVLGSSAGSIVGALCAAGLSAARLEAATRSLSWDLFQRFSLSRLGFYSLEPLRGFVNRETGRRAIERFPTRFAAVATDLQTGALALLDRGEPGLAVQAASSVPGIVQPTRIGERTYIDGSIATPVPVKTARALGAEVVVAVNVSFPPAEAQIRDALDVVMQAFTIANANLTRAELADADAVIAPRLPPDDMNLANTLALIAAGERAAREALPAIRAALAKVRAARTVGDRS